MSILERKSRDAVTLDDLETCFGLQILIHRTFAEQKQRFGWSYMSRVERDTNVAPMFGVLRPSQGVVLWVKKICLLKKCVLNLNVREFIPELFTKRTKRSRKKQNPQ